MTPSTGWKEVVLPGEAERLEALGQAMLAIQKARARTQGAGGRGLHIKAHGGLRAEFAVSADVPAWAKVGMFAEPKTFKAYVRFSNGMGVRQDDRTPDIRGIGVKVVGVPGKKVIPPLADAKTQDFLAILASALPFKTGEDFGFFVTHLSKPLKLITGGIGRFGFGPFFKLLNRIKNGQQPPPGSVLTRNYFSAAPIRFGDYAVRYRFTPVQPAPEGAAGGHETYLADDVAQRVAAGPVAFDFQVQPFIDEQQTPIEDASVDWPSPYVTLARLTILKQDPKSTEGQALSTYVESMSFDPWHAQEELRPLGNFMRARNAAYRLSTAERQACAEPDGTEKV